MKDKPSGIQLLQPHGNTEIQTKNKLRYCYSYAINKRENFEEEKKLFYKEESS